MQGAPIQRKVDPIHPEEEVIREMAEILRDDGVIVFPTETYYALGAHVFSIGALSEVYRLKARPRNLPLLCLVDGFDAVDALARAIPEMSRALMRTFWPGPLTVILPANKSIPDPLIGPMGGVAVRWSSHPVVQALVACTQAAVVGTSANRSGQPPITTIARLSPTILTGIDGVLDGGPTPGTLPSTLIDCTQSPPKVLREGAISLESVSTVIKRTQ